MNTISVTINLPSDSGATEWDFSNALRQAQSDAMLRGDSVGAMALTRLQMLIRLSYIAPADYYHR